MQSENQPKPSLDDDILKCKADLRKMLQSVLHVSSVSQPAADEKPIQSQAPLQSKIEPETKPIKGTSEDPIGIRIPPFELLHKQKTDALAVSVPDHASLSEDNFHKTIEQLNATIGQLEYRLEQQSQFEDQLRQKSEQCDAIAEKNKQLQSDFDASAESVKTHQLQIEALERELGEEIGELSTLKQQAEEKTATLADMAKQIRLTGEEKEAVEKRLDAQAAELAKTLEVLKTTQESTAETLNQRQLQLEALHQTLSEIEARLEQADAVNSQLTREKEELTEALHDAKLWANRQEEHTIPDFDLDSADAESMEDYGPEPYCEPGVEVISEDDVHLEQKLSDVQIPTFNLADQIMAEQRKAAAARRQRPESSGKPIRNGSIEQVMRHYVTGPETPPTPLEMAPDVHPESGHRTERFLRWQGEILSEYQTSLLDGIVRKDIQRFSGIELFSTAPSRPFGKRQMEN